MRRMKLVSLLLAGLLLAGCSMRTLDQLYCVPKRSEEYRDLQSAIDRHMGDRAYCAPLSGDNPQAVQMADLDGDGVGEYLLFSKTTSEKPLNILIFRLEGDGYVLSDTIESAGSAFDLVEYAQVDNRKGMELIVGVQVSDQLLRSVSVYSFGEGQAQQLLNTNYAKFLNCDLDANGRSELMVLRPGSADESRGVAEVYRYHDGAMERSNEVGMSCPVENMKRIITGKLQDKTPAVYVASAVDQNAIITDIFALVDGSLTNVSTPAGSDNSVHTLRNYYVYADDIDGDGIVELPGLITMRTPDDAVIPERQYLIRWFSMTAQSDTVDKAYTFHNYQGGWYVSLDSQWAERTAVVQQEESYAFYLWDEAFENAQKLFTVHAFTGTNRQELATQDNRFVLYDGEDTVYSGYLEVESAVYGITRDSLIRSFHLIQSQWQTGET